MILKFLYLGNLLSLAFSPMLLAPKCKTFLFVFCLRMTLSDKFRKCYRLMLLSIIMMQHLYHLSMFQNHYDLLVSTALSLVFLSSSKADRLFSFLQWKRHFIAFATITILLVFVPHCLMIAYVFEVILFGAGFYPSQQVLLSCSDSKESKNLIKNPELFIDKYFYWSNWLAGICKNLVNFRKYNFK